MADVLSQSQIDMLLNNLIGGGGGSDGDSGDAGAGTGAVAAPGSPDAELGKKVKDYDFRSPKLFTREQLKLIFGMYENYAKILSSQITGTLQTYTLVEMVDVEEQKYYEFNNALPDSVLLGVIDFPIKEDDDDFMFMDISKDIGFCTIDKLLGGMGRPLTDDREYTEIELSILEHFMRNIVSLMRNVWFDFMEVTPRLTKIETNARILQGIAPDDNVVIVAMSILVNETQGMINICIPASTLDTVFKMRAALNKKSSKRADIGTETQRRKNILSNVYETELELKAILGSVMVPTRDVVQLEVGDVIRLDKRENSMVELTVGDTTWFKGEVGVFNKKRAVAIREAVKKTKEGQEEILNMQGLAPNQEANVTNIVKEAEIIPDILPADDIQDMQDMQNIPDIHEMPEILDISNTSEAL